jgi:chromate transporter
MGGAMNWPVLTQLAQDFLGISLLAIGAGITTVPEMHRNAVDRHGWMSSREFSELFALSQAAPGPTTTLFASLIGWKAAGWPGALVAVFALLGPACVFAFFVSRTWERFRGSAASALIQDGFAPVTVGLMFSAAWLVTRGADHSWQAYLATAIAAAMMLVTRINPLWLIAAGAGAGLLGWI